MISENQEPRLMEWMRRNEAVFFRVFGMLLGVFFTLKFFVDWNRSGSFFRAVRSMANPPIAIQILMGTMLLFWLLFRLYCRVENLPAGERFRITNRRVKKIVPILGLVVPAIGILASSLMHGEIPRKTGPTDFRSAVFMVVLFLIYAAPFWFFTHLWYRKSIHVFCPNCSVSIPLDEPWRCGFCGHTSGTRPPLKSFLEECGNCNLPPKAFECPKCSGSIFLSRDQDDTMKASRPL
jgi:hypothetical protein